jgi:hypothetical protein
VSAPGDDAGPPPAAAPDGGAWRAGLGYLAFFALLFLPLPLRGALPGNCDMWLNGIALPNYMLNRIEGALTGVDVGRALYPATGLLGFGESAPGTSAIFVVFKLLTRDDVIACYAMVVVILVLDALGVALLAGLYVRDRRAAVFAGLFFAASNYVLGNLDSPHTSFFAVALVALFFWKRYLVAGARRDLLRAAAFGGAQAYFSAYVFLFLLLAAVVLLAAGAEGRARLRTDLPALGRAALLLAAIAGPFFAYYAHASASANFANPWDPIFLAEVHSLEPSDLARTLEHNVLYPFARPIVAADIGERAEQMIKAGVVRLEDLRSDDAVTVFGSLSSPDDVKYFVYTRRCAFLGFVAYALAVGGLAASSRSRWELGLLYLVGLVVSFGPFIAVGHRLLPNLTLPAYRWLGLTGVLRVPCRAFALSTLAVAIAAALGADRLLAARTPGRRWLLLAALTGAVLLENVPVPLKSFAGTALARPEPLVLDFFKGQHGHVLLDLPSRPGGALFRDSQDLFEWNREIVYMNRQTYHRQNTVNGVHGYFPRSRIQAQRLIDALPAPRAMAGLRALGVDYVVYHHALELPWERGLYPGLAGSGGLRVVASSPEATIFAWAAGGPEAR